MALQGCATEAPPADAFGRLIDDEIQIKPGPFLGCRKADFDHPPQVVLAAIPLYPVGRRMANENGKVGMTFTVSSQGKLEDIVVQTVGEETPGSVWFRNHATIAVRAWQLAPATRLGQPVSTRCKADFNFRMEK